MRKVLQKELFSQLHLDIDKKINIKKKMIKSTNNFEQLVQANWWPSSKLLMVAVRPDRLEVRK